MDTEDPRQQAAAALRRLGHAMMAHEADDDLLLRVAAAAERVVDDLTSQPRRKRDYVEIKRRMYDADLTEGTRVSHFDECFVSGSQNPMGLGMRAWREGDEMVGECTLGPAFEGAPGRAHGGVVAALLDDILGYLTTMRATPAFTGQLDITYLAPTPVGQPLHLRARILGQEGRRMLCEATIEVDGAIAVKASSTFVIVPLEAFRP